MISLAVEIPLDILFTALTTLNYSLEMFIYGKFIQLARNLYAKSNLFESSKEYRFILFVLFYSIVVLVSQALTFYMLFVFRLYNYMDYDTSGQMNKRARWFVLLELSTRCSNIVLQTC